MRMIKWVLALVLVFCLYWFGASYFIRSSIAGWFDERTAEGWLAEYSALDSSGFPLSLTTQLDGVALADPETGVAWQAEGVTFRAPSWWPGHVTLTFADSPQLLSYFDETAILQSEDAVAELRLSPGTNLPLERLKLTSGAWSVSREQGSLFAASGLTVGAQQQSVPETYALQIKADAFRPGDVPRKAMRLPADWPVIWEALQVDMTVTFDRVWDRSALDTSRPQPRVIDLRLAEAKWGALRLFMAGRLTVDAAGTPDGTIAIKADNWRDMLQLAEVAGTIAPTERSVLETTLTFLGRFGGNPNALDVELTFKGGQLSIGPIPLGPAPKIILR